MKILLTGAFGNVGSALRREDKARAHEIVCFDQDTKANRRKAKQQGATVVWGDIRRPEDVARAMAGVDAVIHLAAIIPPGSIHHPALAQQVNVRGTENVIAAARAQPTPPKVAFASSLALYGPTQHLEPPRTLADPINPTDDYTRHKAACETMLAESGLDTVILRLGAVIPIEVLGVLDPLMFDVPLDDRMEFVHPADVGLAFLTAVERDDVSGRTFLVGGGPKCQLRERDIVNGPLIAIGIGALPDEAFGTEPFQLDWADTTESQEVLQYQRYTFEDCIQHMLDNLGWKRPLVKLARPLARRKLLTASPYYKAAHPR
jgi:UDP-glucose 4-epimerase